MNYGILLRSIKNGREASYGFVRVGSWRHLQNIKNFLLIIRKKTILKTWNWKKRGIPVRK